jgi:hypothetical protein
MKRKNLIILMLIPFILSCKKEKNRICQLYSADIAYSIGKINSFEKVPLKVNYKYDYIVNQTQYNGIKKAYGIGQDDSKLLNKSYVVVYDKNNPKNSDLNFEYPVKDSSAFNEHLLSFQSQKPNFSFPRKCN